jgi:hypothetical protein
LPRCEEWRLEPTLREFNLRKLKPACGRVLTYRVLLISGLYDAVASWLEALMAAADVVKSCASTRLQGRELERQQEFVIGSYRPSGAAGIEAPLVGYYEGRDLSFADKVRHANPAGA